MGFASLLTNAASTSSSRMIEFSGASAKRCMRRSSDIPLSAKLSTQMEKWSSPARAVMNEVLPHPGGPYNFFGGEKRFYS